jgi:hypothetical protein
MKAFDRRRTTEQKVTDGVCLDVDLPLKFRVLGEKNWRDGKVQNLSSTEIVFSSLLAAEVGIVLEIRLILPGIRKGHRGGTLVSRAKVTQCSPAVVVACGSQMAAELKNARLLRSDADRREMQPGTFDGRE